MSEINLLVAEKAYLLDCLTYKFPTGIFSYVADSYDYFGVLEKVIPSIRNEILNRDGKFVIRGDSGNPVHVICGYRIKDLSDVLPDNYFYEVSCALGEGYEVVFSDNQYWKPITKGNETGKLVQISRIEAIGTIEYLWEVFGGTTTEKGYKLLDSHIGMIYGDGINAERSREILTRLKDKGFASTNIVFGVGSYLLNLLSRDHLGMAIKATNAIVEIDGIRVDKPIYKDPKTDSSKKSARGLISVHRGEDGEIYFKDQQTREEEETGLLTPTYRNGQFQKLTTIFEIRERIWG